MRTFVSDIRTARFSAGLAILVAVTAGPAAAQGLFQSIRIAPVNEYTGGIEGPSVDAAGNLYVMNFRTSANISGTIGKLVPGAAKSVPFAPLPGGGIGSGSRFDRDGRMYVADFKKHKVHVFEPGQTVPQIYFQSDKFKQPNDLAIAGDGTLYASDPDFGHHTGQIWRITRQPNGKGRGEVMSSERTMGVTNGIDLSPDGTTLYVSEAPTREIWAYRLQDAKLTAPRLVKKFDAPQDGELDGLRTDADGKIFVARQNNRTVAVVTPDGNVVREIPVLGKKPSNLTFGGPDGKTVFVTQVDGRFIESFRVDRPGREFCPQVAGAGC
jgi:sugar lactone lactonase YvrE